MIEDFIFLIFFPAAYFVNVREKHRIYSQLVLSSPCPYLYLGLSMLEGEFFSQCWIPVVLKLQKQRRKQPRTDQCRGSGLTPLPQELLSSNRTSSRCQMVRRAAWTWIMKLILLWQGKGGFDDSARRETSGYFSIDVVLIWESITELCHFFLSLTFFCGLNKGIVLEFMLRILLLFQKLWNDRIKDVKLRCTAEFSLCARQECPVGWAAMGCSFSFMAGQLQFYICLTCFQLNNERQKNITEPPQTLTDVTSSVSDQTKRFNLRKINNCFNARIILSVLLLAALFFPVCNKFSFSLCWIWQQLYPLKLPWIWTLPFFCKELSWNTLQKWHCDDLIGELL